MKNKKVWRMIKKILRTICIWGLVSMMINSVSAFEEMETIPIPPYITMKWETETSTGTVLAYRNLGGVVTGTNPEVRERAVLAYQSALEKDTFYHITIKMTGQNGALDGIETGTITDQGGPVKSVLMPVTTLSPYMTQLQQSLNTGTAQTVSYSYNNIMVQSMDSYVGAKSKYYLTKTGNEITLDCVFYFNEEFFNYGWNYDASSPRWMQCYLGLVFPSNGRLILKDIDVYKVGGSDYNEKLDEIISLLQSQGGGLTRQDIQMAAEQALEAHDRKEEARGEQATTSAEQQAEQAMARYTAVMEQMKTAMAGIEDIKNIDTSTYTLTIGPFTNPMTGGVFPAVGVDFYIAYQEMPAILKSTCPIVVTFFVLMAYAREFLDVFKHVEKTMHGEDDQ